MRRHLLPCSAPWLQRFDFCAAASAGGFPMMQHWLPTASPEQRQAFPRCSLIGAFPPERPPRSGKLLRTDFRFAPSLPQRPGQQQLRHSAPPSNKPHLAEKSTPVWLAIWRTWAGFANSQHRDAAFATPNNICAHSSLLPHWAAAQTDANLSTHLHRLPTQPPYLRRMRLSHGRDAGVGWQMLLLVVRGAVPANHRAHESLF